MKIGIVGLGLIGGSFAKAYSYSGHSVLGFDIDKSTVAFAKLADAIEDELTSENISKCDLVLLCVRPQDAIDYLQKNGQFIGKHPIVIDCCGTKRAVVSAGMELASQYDFTYLGGHPMSGTQFSGFKYSKPDLFEGAPMVIVPPTFDDIVLLEKSKELLKPAKFGSISVTTAQEHDEMIAFTSQLAHIVSNAYIKSPTAKRHKGFSAGSYKDMTRVAWLNAEMWTELFLDNSDCLIYELDALIASLNEYKDALVKSDEQRLCMILEEGKKLKEEVDG